MRPLLAAWILLATWPSLAADALYTRIGWPLHHAFSGAVPAATNFLIDQTTDKVEWAWQMDEAATLTELCFRYGTRTGTPVAHKISLQGVDMATGFPDGTVAAAATFTPPASTAWDGLGQCFAITHDGAGGSISSLAVTRGQFLALVIEPCPNATAPCSGATTPDGSNNSSFTVTFSNLVGASGFPYAIQNAAGTRSKQFPNPCFWVKSASKAYGFPILSVTTTNFDSASTPDERGVRFLLPAGWGATFQVVGIETLVSCVTLTGTVKVALYSGTTELQTVTFDQNLCGSAGNARFLKIYFDETTLSTLNFGTEYRVAFAPADATSDLGVYDINVSAAGDWTAHQGGQNFYTTTRTDAGAWSDTTTARPWIGLILADITDPTGGTSGGSYTFVQ